MRTKFGTILAAVTVAATAASHAATVTIHQGKADATGMFSVDGE